MLIFSCNLFTLVSGDNVAVIEKSKVIVFFVYNFNKPFILHMSPVLWHCLWRVRRRS